jgi:hypothetical protein
VKTFAWNLAVGGLETEEKKLLCYMQVTGRCKIYDADIEDVAHALF